MSLKGGIIAELDDPIAPESETPVGRSAAGTRESGDLALLSEWVTRDLKNLILSGELAPGSRIRQEELAHRFGISRIPVREALRRLEMDGLVSLKPNSGAWVAKLDLRECIEVYKIREQIEPLAIAESAMLIEAEAIDALADMLPELEAAATAEDFLRLDREFHLRCYTPAAMPELLGLILRFWNRTQQYRRAYSALVDDSGREIIVYEHRLIVDSLRRRDSEGAAQLLRGHIRRTRFALAERHGLFA